MVATPYNKKANPVFLVNQADGAAYMAGTDVASSVQITGDALTAMQTCATKLTALLVSIGAAGDAVGANTVIGQLKQIAENTTPT